MLREAREPLKFRFNLLNERFLLKCTSKKNYPIINIKRLEKILLIGKKILQTAKNTLKKSPSFKFYVTNKHELANMHRFYSLLAFERDNLAFFRKEFREFVTCHKDIGAQLCFRRFPIDGFSGKWWSK